MSRLIVNLPDTYKEERRYILSVILREFLGLDYEIAYGGRGSVSISDNNSRHELSMPDCLFATPVQSWLTPATLPKLPLECWEFSSVGVPSDTASSSIPVIFGAHLPAIEDKSPEDNNVRIRLPIDIFGSCFFMLTRYEEIVKQDRDEHDRFTTDATLATQAGFIERPLVNEYVEILWACIKQLWPGLQRRRREYRLCLTHDVDHTLCVVGEPATQVGRRILGDLVVRRDPRLAFQSARAALRKDPENDPCNAFDFMMDVSERYGTTSAFFFIADLGDSPHDKRYDIDHPWTRGRLRRVAERGHTLGIHPTYGSYRRPERLRGEFQRLRRAAEDEGARQNNWGGRQHYLRWENPTTWQHWEDAGIDFDSTIGFADAVGFRAGCCYEYPVYNLKSRMRLKLTEKPLIFMEAAVLSESGRERECAFEAAIRMSETCRRFGGDFTLLWHNSTLISQAQKDSYASLIRSL